MKAVVAVVVVVVVVVLLVLKKKFCPCCRSTEKPEKADKPEGKTCCASDKEEKKS